MQYIKATPKLIERGGGGAGRQVPWEAGSKVSNRKIDPDTLKFYDRVTLHSKKICYHKSKKKQKSRGVEKIFYSY